MIFALPGEAVAAVEVAAVGDVQAECLDVAGIIFELSGDVRIDIRREQFFVIFQFLNLCIAFPQVCLADGLAVCCLPPAVFGEQCGDDFVLCFCSCRRPSPRCIRRWASTCPSEGSA